MDLWPYALYVYERMKPEVHGMKVLSVSRKKRRRQDYARDRPRRSGDRRRQKRRHIRPRPAGQRHLLKDTRADDTIAITAVPAARLSHMLAAVREAVAISRLWTPRPSPRISPSRRRATPISCWSRLVRCPRRDGDDPHSRRGEALQTQIRGGAHLLPPAGREIEDRSMSSTSWGPSFARLGSASASLSPRQQTGQAAQEIEPDGKAAQEIKELYAYVCMNLYADEQGSD